MNRKSIFWMYTVMLVLALIVIFAGSAFAAQASGKPYVRLDVKNAACLMVDHQTGLFNIVRDYEPI